MIKNNNKDFLMTIANNISISVNKNTINKINIGNKIHTIDKIKIELIKENQTYKTNFIFISIK